MCIICVDYERQKISLKSAYRHLQEMREDIGEEHAEEVEAMLEHDFSIQVEENVVKAREPDSEEDDGDDYYEWYEEHGFGD